MSKILLGTREAREAAGSGRENSDQNGIAEFDSVANLDRDLARENAPKLLARAANPWDSMEGAPGPEERRPAMVEMALTAIVSGDLWRAAKYAAELRNAGDLYDSDRLMGNILYDSDRREEAVALWRKCLDQKPGDVELRKRLVVYYRLLRPSQRPKEYEGWLASLPELARPGGVPSTVLRPMGPGDPLAGPTLRKSQ